MGAALSPARAAVGLVALYEVKRRSVGFESELEPVQQRFEPPLLCQEHIQPLNELRFSHP
jgi:hypothetical protein